MYIKKHLYLYLYLIIIILILLSSFLFAQQGNSSLSILDDSPQVSNFISNGNFHWDKFQDFLHTLPFTQNDSHEIISQFLNTLFAVIDKEHRAITKEFMKIIDIKHQPGDIETNLLGNLKMFVLYILKQNEIDISDYIHITPGGTKIFEFFSDNTPKSFLNALLYPAYGIDQAYYVDYSAFSTISRTDISQFEYIELAPGENLADYARLVSMKSQECGSCSAFATSAVLTHYYLKFYEKSLNKTGKLYFVEPYQLLSCSSHEFQVPGELKKVYSKMFPRSNGYYLSHGCFGGMNPELLVWAKYNREKLKIGFQDGKNITSLTCVDGLSNALRTFQVKLGKYCDEITTRVARYPFEPFPEFEIKHIPKEFIFNGKKSKVEIAKDFMKIIKRFGFILISVYFDGFKGGSLFNNCRCTGKEAEHKRTYHYVVIAGVNYRQPTEFQQEKLSLLIHNSWGGIFYENIQIHDDDVECNAANAMWVIDSK